MKNKKLIIKILLVLICVIVIINFYISFLLAPGYIDFYLKRNNYQQIVDRLFYSNFNDIHGIQYNVIYFNNRDSCGFKKTIDDYICDEPYYSILKLIESVHIKDIDFDKEKKIIKIQNYGSNFMTDSTYFYYAYKKDGFSQEEKIAKNVVKIINDNWIVAIGGISIPY